MAHRRTTQRLAGDREVAALAATLGAELRGTRRRRGLKQADLAESVGLRHARISELERGEGASAPLAVWLRIGLAIGRPFAAAFSRDLEPLPRDAGHLAAQELVLELARAHGHEAFFELPTRLDDPSRSVDVGIRDDRHRVLVLVEIVNRVGDLGASARSTARKAAEAAALAAFRDYRVATCWLLVATAANRRLASEFPAVLRAQFPGPSRGWARALASGAEPPMESGICWVDPRSPRIRAVRLRRPTPWRRSRPGSLSDQG
jgi:transcriptional regulator with XRE-family HTH domain